jgi:hypothetical protein
MRSLALVVVLCAACQNRTEIVVGLATDLRAMGQIDLVRLIASRQGTPIVQTDWMLTDMSGGQFELPGSFGLYSSDGSETAITLSVKAYKSNNLVVDRESSLSLQPGETLFLRQTLNGECRPGVGPSCLDTDSCVEGTCQPRAIDAHRLPDYRSELVSKTECDGPVNYIVSSTGAPMDKLGSICPAGKECHEGTCWTSLPGSDLSVGNLDLSVRD